MSYRSPSSTVGAARAFGGMSIRSLSSTGRQDARSCARARPTCMAPSYQTASWPLHTSALHTQPFHTQPFTREPFTRSPSTRNPSYANPSHAALPHATLHTSARRASHCHAGMAHPSGRVALTAPKALSSSIGSRYAPFTLQHFLRILSFFNRKNAHIPATSHTHISHRTRCRTARHTSHCTSHLTLRATLHTARHTSHCTP